MIKILIKQFGHVLYDEPLELNKNYIIGRDSTCDFKLENDKTVSRQHLKITYNGESVLVESLSKFGSFSYNGDFVQSSTIQSGHSIMVSSFEILFEEDIKEVTNSKSIKLHKTDDNHNLNAQAYSEDLSEKTFVISTNLKPFVKIMKNEIVVAELKLEGTKWSAGRDLQCELCINDPRVSRRQFELTLSNSQYFIEDLGSVNGTQLNNTTIPLKQKVPIASGDQISILDNIVIFELRDPHYDQKLVIADPLLKQTDMMNISTQPSPEMFSASAYPKYDSEKQNTDQNKKNKLIRTAALAVLALALVYYAVDSSDSKNKSGAVAQKPLTPFDKLPNEQKSIVKQTYMLAKNLYMQGKYELAKQEIAKIYQYIPEYEDSKELDALADQAIILKQEKEQADKIEKQKQEIEEKIRNQYAFCKGKINSETTIANLESCLEPVLQFNPDHELLTELRNHVQALEDDRALRATQRQDYLEKAKKTEALYYKAESIYKEGELLEAIEAYQKVIQTTLPDPNDYKGLSKRKIASIQQSINSELEKVEKEAQELFDKKDFKNAVSSLRRALKVDPNNEIMKEKVNRYNSELRKSVMPYYQEGVLEESVGNVELAKQKWKKILELDLPDGEYYKKAKIKLKKYGDL